MVVVCSSTTIVDFLVSKGIVRGNKINQRINIPNWILQNDEFVKMCGRGLVDTDGCLYIHRHTVKQKRYINLGFCFTSCSEDLIKSVVKVLATNHITSHIADKNRRIYLYGEKSMVKYLEIFGSSNPRITNIYKIWRDSRVV